MDFPPLHPWTLTPSEAVALQKRLAASVDPAVRTARNVRDSDATLVVSHGPLRGGSLLTMEEAARLDRPALHLDLDLLEQERTVSVLREWLLAVDPRTLNVAGPRASEDPAIGERVRTLLHAVLSIPELKLALQSEPAPEG